MITSDSLIRKIHLPDEIIPAKPLQDPNITYIKRIIKLIDDGENSETHQIFEIKRTKVPKKGTIGIKERMEIKKFGVCVDQSRGNVESGVVRIDNETKIVDRKKMVVQESLKEKIKSQQTGDKYTKDDLMNRMIAEQERERKTKVEIMFQNSQDDRKKKRRRDPKLTDIKITGFQMNKEEQDLMTMFEKIGRVRRCIILRDKNDRSKKRNIAYLEFEQTCHVQQAIDEFNNHIDGNSVMSVCRPEDDF